MRVADLVEAEGRSFSKAVREEGRLLRANAARLGFAAVVLMGGSCLLGLGVIACLIAIFLSVQPVAGTPGAAAIVGVLSVGLGLFLVWFASHSAK